MNYIKLLWNLFKLKRNEKKSYAQIQKLQQKKLREILKFAYEHSPYYRQKFIEASITDENIQTVKLSEIPIIDKSELLEHFSEIVTVMGLTQEGMRRFDAEEAMNRKPYMGKYHVVHSSGSTGKPGYFVYDNVAWNSMLLGIIRGALWNMTMPQILKLLVRGPRIVYLAATDGRYGGAMAVGDGIEGLHAHQLHLDIKTPLHEWVAQIKRFKPNMIIGYPSAIKILAELVEQGDVELQIIRVISCGEPLGSSLRNYLETVFQAQVVNFYGASESLALGVELNHQEGMVLFDDMNVIEMIDGKMYLTSLYNFIQPLIRYHISDQLTLEMPEDNSHSPFTRATGLLGRNEDILWFSDEYDNREFLHPLAIEGFCIEGLLDFQFRQITAMSFEMLAQVSKLASKKQISEEMQMQMNEILREKKLSYVQFKVRFVEEILPDSQTGKKRLIVGKEEKERSLV